MTKMTKLYRIPELDTKPSFSIAILFLYMTRNKANRNMKPSQYSWYFKIWTVIPLSLKKSKYVCISIKYEYGWNQYLIL